MYALPRLLHHLAARLDQWRCDPRLACDTYGQDTNADRHAAAAHTQLTECAEQVDQLNGMWTVMRRHTGRLKLEPDLRPGRPGAGGQR